MPSLIISAHHRLHSKRIAEQRFDDVVRVAPPPPERRRTVVELDDRKAEDGLGSLYEQEYMAATGQAAAAVDKAQPLREEARRLFQVGFRFVWEVCFGRFVLVLVVFWR